MSKIDNIIDNFATLLKCKIKNGQFGNWSLVGGSVNDDYPSWTNLKDNTYGKVCHETFTISLVFGNNEFVGKTVMTELVSMLKEASINRNNIETTDQKVRRFARYVEEKREHIRYHESNIEKEKREITKLEKEIMKLEKS